MSFAPMAFNKSRDPAAQLIHIILFWHHDIGSAAHDGIEVHFSWLQFLDKCFERNEKQKGICVLAGWSLIMPVTFRS